MCKRLFGFLIVAFFLLSGHAWAAPPCPATPQGYVSSGTQILCVDLVTGQVTVLLTDSSVSTVFGDIAFGRDGLLYFTATNTATGGARVVRLNPKITSATAATLVATLSSGTMPTGLSFSSGNGTGDLYVNSSTGVQKIAGAAVTPDASLPIAPVQVITFSPGITAGGNAFDVFAEVEHLTIVDQTNMEILQSAPPFTSATTLASVRSPGPGIFHNFCGDLLVASGKTIERLSLSFSLDKNGNLVVTTTPSTLVNFGGNHTVQYFEVTAGNTVVATTTDGTVWRVDPVKDSTTGVPSCSAIASTTPLVSLKAGTPPDLVSRIANGVALPPTSISITQQFCAGGAPCPTTPETEVYNFGLHTLTVTYKQVLLPFSQSFTADTSLPAKISFSNPPFLFNTVPIHCSPFGGFAIQYATLEPAHGGPVSGVQFAASAPGAPAVQFRASCSTDDSLLDPSLAHASDDTLLTSPASPVTYTDTGIRQDFWFAGSGQTVGGSSDGISEYVASNQALMQNAVFSLQSPVAQCVSTPPTTPSCNPPFNLGATVRFAFNLTIGGKFVSNAIARISIAKVQVAPDGTIQLGPTIPVICKNSVDNFFKLGNNLYTCPWDSSVAAISAGGPGPGLYMATMFSDSFPVEPPLSPENMGQTLFFRLQ